MIYGYIRVSTKEQNEARQVEALRTFGVSREQMYLDKVSGKTFLRPQYQKLLRKIKKGDVMVVKSIDRLGRNYQEIIEQWRILTREKQVNIVVLDMPLLDTRRSLDLTGTLISDIVLQLLSYVAQTERELIHQRQMEGIAVAKANGVRFGRRPMVRPEKFQSIARQWRGGELSARRAAEILGVTHKTFLKWARQQADSEY